MLIDKWRLIISVLTFPSIFCVQQYNFYLKVFCGLQPHLQHTISINFSSSSSSSTNASDSSSCSKQKLLYYVRQNNACVYFTLQALQIVSCGYWSVKQFRSTSATKLLKGFFHLAAFFLAFSVVFFHCLRGGVYVKKSLIEFCKKNFIFNNKHSMLNIYVCAFVLDTRAFND